MWLLAIASIPVGIAGLLFDKQAETTWRNPYLIGAMLIAVGVLMGIADRRTNGRKGMGLVNGIDAIVVGLAQAFAVVPGTSRSGSTITAGLFRDFSRETAARFSFLLLTPAVAAAVAKKSWDIHKSGGLPHEMRVPFALGIVVSGIAGAIVIALFLRYLRGHSLAPFVWYRVIFGIIVIALAVFFRFHAE